MAIEFDCPHCGHHYRLKDELAGKAAACKNCRQKITIPHPVTVPDDTPPPVDVEAAALAALADEKKAEEDASKKLIEVECQYCSHKWTEPISRAGKNALCPNPECRQRVKIPEPKDEGQYDWRQTRTKGPSLAKDKQEKLEGVQDAGQAQQVSGEALKKGGAIEEELEPRPLRQKVMFVLVPLVLLASLVFGVMYLWRSGKEVRDDKVMANGQAEFMASDFAKVDAKSPKERKEEVALFTAVMHLASAEYALRHNDYKQLSVAMDQYRDALTILRPLTSPTRNALVAELALSQLALGGTEEQARNQVRIRWMPDPNLKTTPTARTPTVYEELRNVLGMLQQSSDFDFRAHFARRLTRELVKIGHPEIAEVIPLALFKLDEQPEARAIVALELHRANVPGVPAATAESLAKLGPDLAKANPRPASAQMLFAALNTPNAPTVLPAPQATGVVSDDVRFAYTGVALAQKKPAEALAMAQREGRPNEKLRSLVLCADWMDDPSPALDAAYSLVAGNKTAKDAKLPPHQILRLAQIAAEKGKHDLASKLADGLPDAGMRAWILGDALRVRLAAAPAEKGDESWMELPAKDTDYRAGHAWGRLWLARQNARISGNRGEQVKIVSEWPTPFHFFGKAGVALGLQDK
jgi:DNA-directed RNA polymerase subunit RPC12/RpoP